MILKNILTSKDDQTEHVVPNGDILLVFTPDSTHSTKEAVGNAIKEIFTSHPEYKGVASGTTAQVNAGTATMVITFFEYRNKQIITISDDAKNSSFYKKFSGIIEKVSELKALQQKQVS